MASRSRSTFRSRFPRLENLEPRRCLIWEHPALAGGVLTFTGTGGADTLENIKVDPATDFVLYGHELLAVNGTTIDEDDVFTIVVYGKEGNDTIDLSGGFVGFTNQVRVFASGGDNDDQIFGPPAITIPPTGHTLRGDDGNDEIVGSNGDDIIEGGGNDIEDRLSGGAGNDTIYGCGPSPEVDGQDRIRGGTGNDILYGNGGEDDIGGGDHDDWIYGNEQDDTLVGDEGRDHIYGGAGNDNIGGGVDIDWTFSNNSAADADQPFFPGAPGHHMYGSGNEDCDIEDGWIECDLAAISGIIGYGGCLDVAAPGVLDDYAGLGWTAAWYSDTTSGNVTVNPDGSFTYEALGAPTTDTFQYVLTDGTNTTHPATATVNFTNPAPVAVNDSYSASGSGYGDEFNFSSVLANDTWTPCEDRQVLLHSGYTQPTGGAGSVVFNQDGSFTFNRSHNWVGETTFTYFAHDFVQSSASPATVTITLTNALMFADAPLANSSAQAVTLAQAQAVLTAAGERWLDAGLSSATLNEVLAGVSIVVTDLPGAQLSGFAGSVIYVDINAAGYGWNLDTTDNNFTAGNNESTANAGSDAAGKVDLLTALEHELGHLFGLPHSSSPGNIMNDELDLGVRRSVTAHDAALAELMYQANKRRG